MDLEWQKLEFSFLVNLLIALQMDYCFCPLLIYHEIWKSNSIKVALTPVAHDLELNCKLPPSIISSSIWAIYILNWWTNKHNSPLYLTVMTVFLYNHSFFEQSISFVWQFGLGGVKYGNKIVMHYKTVLKIYNNSWWNDKISLELSVFVFWKPSR